MICWLFPQCGSRLLRFPRPCLSLTLTHIITNTRQQDSCSHIKTYNWCFTLIIGKELLMSNYKFPRPISSEHTHNSYYSKPGNPQFMASIQLSAFATNFPDSILSKRCSLVGWWGQQAPRKLPAERMHHLVQFLKVTFLTHPVLDSHLEKGFLEA